MYMVLADDSYIWGNRGRVGQTGSTSPGQKTSNFPCKNFLGSD